MARIDIDLPENEYTRIDIGRPNKPFLIVFQDGKGNLIIEYGTGNRILDERANPIARCLREPCRKTCEECLNWKDREIG